MGKKGPSLIAPRYASRLRRARMAMLTLVLLFNNEKVFQGVVKVRKPRACRIMMECDSNEEVRRWFVLLAKEVEAKSEQMSHREAEEGEEEDDEGDEEATAEKEVTRLE